MEKPIWIIAHGSSNVEWINKVDAVISKVKHAGPIITSFLENVEERSIEDGIKEIRSLKVNQITVIPLFVSSGSNHIVEIKEMLSAYKEFNFTYSNCMDDDPLVVKHIVKLANEVATHDENEDLLIIGHGSYEESGREIWRRNLETLAKEVAILTDFNQVAYATYYPYTIDIELKNLGNDHTIIVIPLFLSSGYFTDKKIPELLKDYKVKYNNKAYLDEEDWIVGWIGDQIKKSS